MKSFKYVVYREDKYYGFSMPQCRNTSLVWAVITLIAASWILGFLANRAWAPLIGPTFRVVEWLLLAFGQEVVSQPADLLLGTPQFAVTIYPTCAGYEGIGLISVFVGSSLWLAAGYFIFLDIRLRSGMTIVTKNR